MSIKLRSVKSISLDIPDNCFLVVKSKTEKSRKDFLDLLGGYKRSRTGTIIISGYDISDLKRGEKTRFYRNEIGFIPEDFYLEPHLNIRDNLSLAGIFENLSKSDLNSRVKNIARKYQLTKILKMKPEKISDEEKRRVCIARTCLMKPKVILAYEPTKGLEPAEAENTIELIMQVAKDNEAILIVSSDDENVIKRADMEVDLSGEKK